MVSVLSSAVEVCWGSPWSWGFKTCGHLDRVVEWGWQWRWLFGSGRNRQDLSLFLFVFVVFVCICICCHSVFLYVILGVVSGKLSDGLAVGGVWVNLRGWAPQEVRAYFCICCHSVWGTYFLIVFPPRCACVCISCICSGKFFEWLQHYIVALFCRRKHALCFIRI